MATQELEAQASAAPKREGGKFAKMLSLGFMTRRQRPQSSLAWRETVTQHAPEPWLEARRALQARIAALDYAREPASSQ
jgi:hypothetical protein